MLKIFALNILMAPESRQISNVALQKYELVLRGLNYTGEG